MNQPLTHLIFLAGLGQVTILIASALVPFRLNWRDELRGLATPSSADALGVRRLCCAVDHRVRGAQHLATPASCKRQRLWPVDSAAMLRCFGAFGLLCRPIFDIKGYLNTWWAKAGYFALTLMFTALTIVYSWAALHAG